MNLKKSAADKLTKSVLDNIMLDFKNLKEEYLESNEFDALVASRISKISGLLDMANDMYDAVEELPSGSYIVLDKYTFTYNSELDAFEYDNIENRAKSAIVTELMFDGHYDYRGNTKNSYISNKVSAIISVLDENVTHDQALNIVREQLDLVEILHNKNI